jgi:hypothetical protein
MTAKLTLFVVCCTAFGQMDTSTLRAKYGEPIARETFQVRPNIEAVVNYGTGHQVCRIDLPPGSYVNPPHGASNHDVDQVIDELVPPAMRGKAGSHLMAGSGRIFMSISEYENITISEPQDPDHSGRRTAVWTMFKRPDCREIP